MRHDEYMALTMRTAARWKGQGSNLGATIQRLVEWPGRNLPQSMNIFHGILGIAGEEEELRELMDPSKGYNKALKRAMDAKSEADRVEVEEIKNELRQDIVKELGDILWYVAQACEGLAISMSSMHVAAEVGVKIASGKMEATGHIGETCSHPQEIFKKWIMYGREAAPGELETALMARVRKAFWAANAFVNKMGLEPINPEEAYEANIAKLRRRFPQNFDASLASTHDGK